MNFRFLIIDPQNDFHDLKESALPVKGSLEDATRLASALIGVVESTSTITSIAVTMDSHAKYDIAHPAFWVNTKGKHPDPFTQVSVEDITNKVLRPVDGTLTNYVQRYVDTLVETARDPLLIWPEHCLEGSNGWEVYPVIADALFVWSTLSGNTVNYYKKGTDIFTEHFGAFEPEVGTINSGFDQEFFDSFIESTSDNIVIAGQALSHCVGESLRQILSHTSRPGHDFTLLVDASSPVPGFEDKGTILIEEFREQGINIRTVEEFLNELP